MIITYFGEQFFKITQGDMVLAFNPVSKNSKSDVSTHFGADIALITTNYSLYNGVEQLSHGERMPFVIHGPADYINTIYSFLLDNINIAFLGALSDSDISKEAHEAINTPDIIFVPVGGKSKDVTLLDTKTSAKLALSFEPKLIIPMSYDDNSLKSFLKEVGEENAEVVDKLTLKLKDLDGKEAEVIVLKPN